jgi:metal-responsive CopG/Arc/MetJ family transcriptional regulator
MDRLQLLIPKQLRERLKAAMDREGLSASEIIRSALKAYLKGMGL